MSQPPNIGARVAPNELNACVIVSLDDAVFASPSTLTKGLAETCNKVIPAANTNSAPKKAKYDPVVATG